jgi:hypothetical protein
MYQSFKHSPGKLSMFDNYSIDKTDLNQMIKGTKAILHP